MDFPSNLNDLTNDDIVSMSRHDLGNLRRRIERDAVDLLEQIEAVDTGSGVVIDNTPGTDGPPRIVGTVEDHAWQATLPGYFTIHTTGRTHSQRLEQVIANVYGRVTGCTSGMLSVRTAIDTVTGHLQAQARAAGVDDTRVYSHTEDRYVPMRDVARDLVLAVIRRAETASDGTAAFLVAARAIDSIPADAFTTLAH